MTEAIDRQMIVEMVRSSTMLVCSKMLSLDVACRDSYTEMHPPRGMEGVVSLIGFTGKRAGTGSIHCSSKVACSLASSFVMSEFESVNEEVLDAFGELTNMVIGNLKTQMEAHLGPLGLSIPTVIYGRNFNTRSLGHEEWTVVPFMWDEGSLEVNFCLKDTKEGDRSVRHGRKHEFLLGV
jgi:chemotaxis protein CheX